MSQRSPLPVETQQFHLEAVTPPSKRVESSSCVFGVALKSDQDSGSAEMKKRFAEKIIRHNNKLLFTELSEKDRRNFHLCWKKKKNFCSKFPGSSFYPVVLTHILHRRSFSRAVISCWCCANEWKPRHPGHMLNMLTSLLKANLLSQVVVTGTSSHVNIWNHLRAKYMNKEMQARQSRKLEFSFEWCCKSPHCEINKRPLLFLPLVPLSVLNPLQTQSHCSLRNTLVLIKLRALDIQRAFYCISATEVLTVQISLLLWTTLSCLQRHHCTYVHLHV